MKKRFNKFPRIFFFLLGIIFILAACSNRPKDVMDQKEMADFLTDLHKLDGSLVAKGIISPQDRENVYYYNALLRKHGITQAVFDSSLVWYTKNPKRFEKIYAQVLDNLTEFEAEVKSKNNYPVDSAALRHIKQEIWTNPTQYVFTKDSARTQVEFTIQNPKLRWKDIYTLSLLQRIAPQDSSAEKHIVMRIKYSDGKTDSIYATTYNDSILRRYTLRLAARHKQRIESITGALLGSKAYKGKMNSRIDSIKLIREYDELAQDSITRIINRMKKHQPVVIPKEKIIDKKQIRSKVVLDKNETGK
ncbi:MAG: DUF4296 domain-containing protein [Bacteroidales bacterium]|nr:DUF4296 domain-containing protein [Bacteroidales bacterium]